MILGAMNHRSGQAPSRISESGSSALSVSVSPGSTNGVEDSPGVTAPVAGDATKPLPLLIGGRYQGHRLLKEGNGIATFLATDDFAQDSSAGLLGIKTTPLTALST